MANIQFSKEKTFTDLHQDLLASPLNGDALVVKDNNAIKQSVKNLILTDKYDRLHQPDIVGGLNQYLFEPISNSMAVIIEQKLEDIILNYEPRVELIQVNVSAAPNNNRYDIDITFSVKSSTQTQTIDFFLERVV